MNMVSVVSGVSFKIWETDIKYEFKYKLKFLIFWYQLEKYTLPGFLVGSPLSGCMRYRLDLFTVQHLSAGSHLSQCPLRSHVPQAWLCCLCSLCYISFVQICSCHSSIVLVFPILCWLLLNLQCYSQESPPPGRISRFPFSFWLKALNDPEHLVKITKCTLLCIPWLLIFALW